MESGIYWIRNKINNKIYIGSSTKLRERFNNHKSKLTRNVHANPHLQSAWNLYGDGSFEFKWILKCHSDLILWYEQQFLDQWKPEYNINILAHKPNPRKYTQKEKNKVSREHSGKIVSSETRKRMSDARKGMVFSDEHRKNLSLSHLGYKHSDETKKKMSKSHLRRG